MAKITKSRKSGSKKPEKAILEQFLAELGHEIDAREGNVSRRITKGQALVKGMVNGALKGDQRMLASILRLVDKLNAVEEEPALEEEERSSEVEWEGMFAFFGQYKSLIEQEIERLRETNPSYWSFDWYRPTLENAPWYKDIYGEKRT